MKINVSVKTKAKKEGVEKQSDGSYIVRVNTPPVDGKANKRVIELLAKHLGYPKSNIHLAHGAHGKNKVFEIRASS